MATWFMLWTSSLLQNLRAPSSMNHRYNYSASFNQGGLSEDSLVSLYDDNRKHWNWELHPPPGSDSPPEQPRPLASELPVELEKLCIEKQVALFLNAIGTAAKSMMPSLSSKPQCQWMVDWSRTSLQGSTANFFDFAFMTTLVVQSHPLSNIHTDAEVFIYILLLNPWLQFDHRDIPPSCTQLQMHSTWNTSLPFPLSYNAFSSLGVRHPPQCKLTPGSHITQTHLSNQEDPSFLGRGTVCYLTCYNGEYYVIKDYWVEESEQRTALHEVNMMKLVQDIDRVPKLQHYWVVKIFYKVMLQGEYDLGGTEAITKSGKTNVPSIQKNDIESLFYIFIWILILYDGPLDHECQDISHEKTLLGLWSEKAAKDLKITRCAKFTFLNDLSKLRLDSKVSQYFQDLIPLANKWHILLGQSLLSGTAVQFSDVISLFDHFLASIPYEKPLEMMNAFQ
ncbi:hypothetical protein F5J12DRAFT_787214 [Pisolithus orientalis]|uniref:uncharacterized protein n=1 Tax=Pisolithus orientalis TaxID=936130 RepID=UPI002223EEB9|nr:uncharacterized protein F5J12DRAFT_787214 [Pisolithus orientalis]KAI5986703.1 hypothetical protein F5J12DRAFT_787214 [Pisolithus orientalis]